MSILRASCCYMYCSYTACNNMDFLYGRGMRGEQFGIKTGTSGNVNHFLNTNSAINNMHKRDRKEKMNIETLLIGNHITLCESEGKISWRYKICDDVGRGKMV